MVEPSGHGIHRFRRQSFMAGRQIFCHNLHVLVQPGASWKNLLWSFCGAGLVNAETCVKPPGKSQKHGAADPKKPPSEPLFCTALRCVLTPYHAIISAVKKGQKCPSKPALQTAQRDYLNSSPEQPRQAPATPRLYLDYAPAICRERPNGWVDLRKMTSSQFAKTRIK